MKITAFICACALLIIFSSCSKKGDSTGDIERPDISSGCLSGQCVPQFQTTYQRFAVVAGDAINLRSRPDVSSRIAAILPATRKVTVLYVEPEEKIIGGMTGHWAFVRDASDLKREGWVFDYFLGYPARFAKPERWTVREIRVILRGKLTVYRCTPDARFEIVQDEMLYKKDGPRAGGKVTGDILRYQSVLWFKKDVPDDYPIFFQIGQRNTITLADQYRDMRGVIMVR